MCSESIEFDLVMQLMRRKNFVKYLITEDIEIAIVGSISNFHVSVRFPGGKSSLKLWARIEFTIAIMNY